MSFYYYSPLVTDIETVAIDDAAGFLEPIEAPSNYKDPAKIAEYVANAAAKAADRCALDPDLCRVVAIGAMASSDEIPVVWLCQNEAAEKTALEMFWQNVVASSGAHRRLVTFCGLTFDLPILLRRSQYLNVDAPVLNLDRYRTPHIDVVQKLTFNGAIKGHGLKFYARRFGIPFDDEVAGADIPTLVREGHWDAVQAHCISDTQLTAALARRLGYFAVPEPAEVV